MIMRKFSKHAPEQIVVKLEKVEALGGEGMSAAQACRVLGIGEATLCRWRQRYGSMSRSEAKELRELREQNARLKQLLGQAELEKAALRELARDTSRPGAPARGCQLPGWSGVFSASCTGALPGCPGQRIAAPARRAGRKRCVIMGLCASG